MSFDSLLTHTCQLGTQTSTSNYLGEVTYTWTFSTTDTSCRFVPVMASQRIELAGKFDDVKYTVYFNSGVAVSGGKKLQFNGLEYIVRDSHLDSSSHHLTCLVAEVP